MDQEPQKSLPTELPKELSSGQTTHQSPTPQSSYYPKTLLSWTAPGRPFKKRGRQFFATSLLLALLIEVILFLFGQYILMLVVASLVFLSFSFVLVPPKDFHYKITSEGVMVEDHFFLWQELYDFYFRRREGVYILMIRTHTVYPGELSISLGDMDRNHVIQVMSPYLPFREFTKPTFIEKSSDWMAKNFPLEKKAE